MVVDADTGVGYGTRRMMEHAKARNLCRVIVINKIDHPGAKLGALLDDLRDTFGAEVLPLNLPADGGKRVVDCFWQSTGDSNLGPVADWHQKIIDQVVEVNETVMDRYLDQGESGLQGEELHDAFEQCLREGHLVPVCFVSARSGAGVRELLDVAERLFPHPGEGNPPPFVKGSGDDAAPIEAKPDPNAHVIADVFKIINDPFVGKLGIFRVYQGTVKKDTQLFVDDGKKPFKVAHLFKLKGKDHVEIDQAIPGDIAAVAKIDELHFDAVLHDSHDEDQIHLAPLAFPRPMFGLAIEAARKGQEQKLATALHKLAEEDPCFHVEHETETNETVIRGLSDLHLRINLDRLKEKYGVEVELAPAAHRLSRNHRRQGRRPSPAQEADRRRRPVRRGVPAHRTAAARQRLRIRRRGQGRDHSGPVPARRRKRRAPGAARRRGRRVSDAGRARDRLRRQAPRGRQQGGRVRRRRQEGLPRRHRQGRAAACSSRSSTSRSMRRNSTWATSAAAWPASARASTAPTRCAAARSWSRRRCRCRSWRGMRRS